VSGVKAWITRWILYDSLRKTGELKDDMKDKLERGNKRLRMLDACIGIPAVLALGLTRIGRKTDPIHSSRNVAILHTAAIGDTVILSAAVSDIRVHYPDAILTVFTGESNHAMARLLPGIDRLIKLPVSQPFACIRSIRKTGKFDIWIDFGPWPRINALFTHFADAGLKIGFKTRKQYRHYLYDIVAEHSDKVHELDNYRMLLKTLGIEGCNWPSIDVPSAEKVNDRITIHMFPGGFKSHLKEWPIENWLEIINVLNGEGYEVFLTGALADKEKASQVGSNVLSTGRVKVVAGNLDLRQTAVLLRSSQLVVTVNTGIMHLAAALGCDLIALHGPTSVKRWGPLSSKAVPVKSDLSCSPCLNLGFEYGCNKNRCMASISVQDVMDKIKTKLKI
jgi:heptosyltransferase I